MFSLTVRRYTIWFFLFWIFIFLSRNACAGLTVQVTVEGVEGELKKNIRAYLGIEHHKEHPDLTPTLLRKLHKKAPDEIRKALQPFGYYSPVIQIDLQEKDSTWHAVYTIDPGTPVLIETVNLSITGEGADNEHFIIVAEAFAVKKGEILNHQIYEQSKRTLHDTALKNGYLKAEINTQKVEVNPDKHSAIVTIHFDTGPQHFFGDVEFIQDTFDPLFLKRFIPFRTGEPYYLSRLLQFQNALNDSDYFESVEINPLLEKIEEQKVPIEVKILPRKRNKFTIGVGYGTDTGLRGRLGWELRRVNKRGHRFKMELRPSEIRSALTAEYLIPLKKVRTDALAFTGGWSVEDTKTADSEKYFGGLQYNHVRGRWKESVYVTFEQEKYEIGDEAGRSTLLIPGISWMRIRADNPIAIRRGSRIFLDIRGAHDSVISDTSFLQLRLQTKYIRAVTSSSRLIVRGEGGTSVVSEFSELPASVRFFAGGDHSVRGYAYNSLGPEDEKGNVKGGKHLLAGSLEYEYKIKNKWSAAAFYDIGNAIDSFSDPFRSGAGFGIRWKSPVGPIRFDLAFPLDDSEKSWRIHLIIGPDL